jgi:protein involved in ribonucleotide reduction
MINPVFTLPLIEIKEVNNIRLEESIVNSHSSFDPIRVDNGNVLFVDSYEEFGTKASEFIKENVIVFVTDGNIPFVGG